LKGTKKHLEEYKIMVRARSTIFIR